MKSIQQVNDARRILRQRIQTPGLTDVQKSLIMGMVNALVWVADGASSATMERMLSDEPLAPGKDHTRALERFDKAIDGFKCPRCGQPMAHSRLRGMFCLTCH